MTFSRLPLMLVLACCTTSSVPQRDAGESCQGSPSEDFNDAPVTEPLAGAATISEFGDRPFGTLLSQVPLEQFQQGSRGREFFVAEWEPGAGGRELLNGLGPHFHVTSCQACHPVYGRPKSYPSDTSSHEVGPGILFRLRTVEIQNGNPVTIGADAHYGAQLQPRSIAGLPAEAVLKAYAQQQPLPPNLANAPRIQIGKAFTVVFDSLGFGPLGENTQFAPRLSPHLTGMGLIDAITDREILEWADPDDLDSDGISGRPHWIGTRLGRYGWKAVIPTLREQVAMAFAGDMGITSSVSQDDCTEYQEACRASENGGTPEISESGIDAIVTYLQLLGVPKRSSEGLRQKAGYQVFIDSGCAACHRPTMSTAEFDQNSVLSGQRIHAFTDLLLHDMGSELSDGIPNGDALGSEWRTPPLWGIGRVAKNPDARFLHDGRASTLREAILLHGGEGEGSVAAFNASCLEDQTALLSFLQSL